MRRTLLRLTPAVAVLVAALACSPGALARGGAGHNDPTKKLEDAFKIALYVRSVSSDGCYPQARPLATKIVETKRGLKVRVANGLGGVNRRNIVFVLKHGSNCNKVIMALRSSSGIYVLDSAQGTIRVHGRAGPRVVPGIPGPPRSLLTVTKTFRMSAPDQLTRLEVLCPGGRYPIGGGMTVNVPPGLDGEGVYPHSYERLGAQRGFHISEVLYDPDWSSTTPRNITLQAVCARGQIPQNPTPHKTVFMLPGQTKSAIARCPKGQQLITGGFQRTNFASDGGNYITESRAAGSNGWKVTGSAFIGSGTTGGGELTAIARGACASLRPASRSTRAAPSTRVARSTPATPRPPTRSGTSAPRTSPPTATASGRSRGAHPGKVGPQILVFLALDAATRDSASRA